MRSLYQSFCSYFSCTAIFVTAQFSAATFAGELLESQIASQAIGRSVEYAILFPDEYHYSEESYPLVLLLHGAGGTRDYLRISQAQIESLWQQDVIPDFVVATASVPAGTMYMDLRDGSGNWESFMMQEFLPHLRATYKVSADRHWTIITGISMGGAGSSRLAFKYPQEFGAVALMEAGIWAGRTWGEVPEYLKIRTPSARARLFGEPFDEAYWEANNPATILADNPQRILDAGLQIYIDSGDLDAFGYHENAEYMHRLLWDLRIPHEYHLVRWSDHIGNSLQPRLRSRREFIGRYLRQPTPPEADLEAFRLNRARRYQEMGFEPFPFWPNEARRLQQ